MNESKRFVTRLACVGVLVCVIFPLGRLLFPMAADVIGAFPFTALEAVVTTSLGFGLFEVLFG